MLDPAPLLRRSLVANGAFSATCGGIFLLASEPVARYLGLTEPAYLRGLGLGLLAFAAHLAWASSRRIPPVEALYFVVSDALWVVGTLVLLVVVPTELSLAGRASALGVAMVVGLFCTLQALGLRQNRPS